MYSGSSKRRGAYFGSKSAYTPPPSRTSSTISVIGRRPAPSTVEEDTRTTVVPPKRMRLSRQQFSAMQRRDMQRDEALLKSQLNRSELVNLAEFQQELGAGTEIVYNDVINDVENNSNVHDSESGSVHDDDDDDAWEDEAAAIEEFGISSTSRKAQKRSEWSERIMDEHADWLEQLSELTDAYLEYRLTGPPNAPVNGDENSFLLDCLNLESEGSKRFKRTSTYTNATLLRNGYLAPSPRHPKLAFSLLVLDILVAVQRRGPSVSAQVMAKAFCDLRNVPYKRYFRVQLTLALDAYYLVLGEVQRRLDVALGRDAPDWRMKNSCGACTYRLIDEPVLRPAMLTTCDGGDSNKRCAAAGTSDRRKYNSSYYLTPEQVNVFKNEVPTRKGKKSASQVQEEATDPSECEKRWKNAKVDNNPDRKSRSIFDETGIFISACRHSFILTICDMIQSGEQAKYPLATIDKLMSVYGPDIMMGYDIGCTFKGTAERSPLLGQRVKDMGFDMCLGSFHGPAHNRLCQLRNHPHNREGTGLSPLENAEQIFSSSNRIASLVRLASKYHRQQRIHIHFDAWDEDQHQNLGYLLRTKYMRALEEYDTAESTMAKLRPGVLATKLEEYIEQEKLYLESLKTPLKSELFAIEYLGLLEKLEAKRAEYNHCESVLFVAMDGPSTSDLRHSALKTAKIETRRRNTLEQLLTIQEAVAKLEEKHNITRRWTRTSKEWIEAQKTRKDQQYHTAIDELERLVVQRLFELSRAGLAGTGYKLRQHIVKAVCVRSKAVQVALDKYNKLASELVPPSRNISWDSIAKAKVLEDFDILRGSRWGIEEEEWSKPENRRCAEQARRLKRAEEEIQRLNVEVRRVRTLIVDEARSLPAAVSRIASQDAGLGWAAQRYVDRRLRANKLVSAQLTELENMRSFSGQRNIGVRVGTTDFQSSNNKINATLPADHEVHDAITMINSQEPSELSDSDSDEETTSEQVDRWQSMVSASRST